MAVLTLSVIQRNDSNNDITFPIPGMVHRTPLFSVLQVTNCLSNYLKCTRSDAYTSFVRGGGGTILAK